MHNKQLRKSIKVDSPLISTFQEIYFIIVSLAIVNSLRVYIGNYPIALLRSVVWSNYCNILSCSQFNFWLLASFLITIIRFSLGFIVFLRKHKLSISYPELLLGFHYSIITLLFFYYLSEFIPNKNVFCFIFMFLILFDSIWVLIFERDRFDIAWVWLVTNILIFIFLWTFNPLLIFIITLLAAYIDYKYCRPLY